MTHFDRTLRSQFFLTGPRPCPYLPDRRERKLFTNLSGSRARELHDELAQLGFRRSQNIAYRPACANCAACVSTRVRVDDFKPTGSQQRTLRRNADLRRAISDPAADPALFELFKRYLSVRHTDGGMNDMDSFDFAAMIEDTPVGTRLVTYRQDEPLEEAAGSAPVAACVTDIISDGLSMVYSFFEPNLKKRSLGQYIILDHIKIAHELQLPYLYLGYWVEGSPKMDYKIKFKPAEILVGDKWISAKNRGSQEK